MAENDKENPPPDESQAKLEQALHDAGRLRKELAEAKKLALTEEDRAEFETLREMRQRLEAEAEQRETNEAKNKGDIDLAVKQVDERWGRKFETVEKQNKTLEQEVAQERAMRHGLLKANAFATASSLFGDSGRTVLIPEIAETYFANHIEVQRVQAPDGQAREVVVVKDVHGMPILDPRTGEPKPFDEAMGELIEMHPRKAAFLRGSGKAGSGSSGGANDGQATDLDSLNKRMAQGDPEAARILKHRQSNLGGMQMGKHWNRQKGA